MTFWYIAIIGVMVIGFGNLSDKIDKIMKDMPDNSKKAKKGFPSLKDVTGQKIEIALDDDTALMYDYMTRGILKEYNDTWLVLEASGKNGKKELYYHRIRNIVSINILEEEGI